MPYGGVAIRNLESGETLVEKHIKETKMPDIDRVTIPASLLPSGQRANQFKGLHLQEADEPLLATLE
jgi:hypothetical protein